MSDFNTRQTVALESTSRKKVYDYLCNGIEPASVNEIASDLDEKAAGVLDDLEVLVDVDLVERVRGDRGIDAFTTPYGAEVLLEREDESRREREEAEDQALAESEDVC